MSNHGADTVQKIDPATDSVIATITVGAGPESMVFDGVDVWVAEFDSNRITQR